MSALVLAQAGVVGAVAGWVIIAIVVAAIIGIGMVVLRATGVAIPPWVITIFWIVLVAFVAVVAIKFLVTMM